MRTLRTLGCGWALALGGLLGGLLGGCGAPEAEVDFARPFPANAPDLREFPAWWQGQYVAVNDTALHLSISPRLLVSQRFLSLVVTARQLDSMGLPPHLTRGRDPNGAGYQVQAAGADSARLRWEERDTLAALGPRTKLRRYHNLCYLNTSTADSTTWAVQRLTVVDGRFSLQKFNPDTLRIRALGPATVQLRRKQGSLFFTLDPRPGRATRQVHSYDGLWLPAGEYQRRARNG